MRQPSTARKMTKGLGTIPHRNESIGELIKELSTLALSDRCGAEHHRSAMESFRSGACARHGFGDTPEKSLIARLAKKREDCRNSDVIVQSELGYGQIVNASPSHLVTEPEAADYTRTVKLSRH